MGWKSSPWSFETSLLVYSVKSQDPCGNPTWPSIRLLQTLTPEYQEQLSYRKGVHAIPPPVTCTVMCEVSITPCHNQDQNSISNF